MNPREALTALNDAAALWIACTADATDVVDAACTCLVSGLDGPTLRMLAGASSVNAREEVTQWLDDTLTELGLPSHPRHGREVMTENALRAMARKLLNGSITPNDLTSWAHGVIGHDNLPLAENLVHLDDVYDCLDYTDTTRDDIDADVIAEARRLAETAASTPDPPLSNR